MPKTLDYFKALPLYPLPHHLLSRMMLRLTRVKNTRFKNAHIDWFIKQFKVDMSLAAEPEPHAYADFNSFFTRALREDARPVVDGAGQLACPVDGAVSQCGPIESGRLFQAKGRYFRLVELLGGDYRHAEAFQGGSFTTIYLSPRDYHRLHMPCDGVLREMIHIPGRLFSVNQASAKVVPNLFARNERVVCLFDTPHGPTAMILVGAIFVGSIETVWHGVVTPPSRSSVKSWQYPEDGEQAIRLSRGAEMGRFNMGSTVIMLFGKDAIGFAEGFRAETPVCMGELMANSKA